MLWYVIIAVGFATSIGILHFGYAKPRDLDSPFKLKDLVTGRRTVADSSRKQLLIEGYFLLGLSAVVLVYKLLR